MNRLGYIAMGGVCGAASPLLGFMFFDSYFTREITDRVNKRNHEVWARGDRRPKRLVLVRASQTHGYSHTCDCLAAGLPVCSLKPAVNRPLTEEGKLQALKAGVALKHVIGDETVTFFVSPYTSCKQTFSYISGSFTNLESCHYVEDPRLRNIDRGDFFMNERPESLEQFQKDSERVGKFFYRWPGGESPGDVYDRVCSFLESLYRKWKHADRPDNFVIITHNVVIQLFLMRWFHWDLKTFDRLQKFKNGQIAIMEKQDDGSYKLVTPLPCEAPVPLGVKFLAD